MEMRFWMTAILAGLAVVAAAAMPLNAQGKDGNSTWSGSERSWPDQRPELTAERTDRLMDRLKQADPNKAAELEKLRSTDPNAFRAAIRKAMRERFRGRTQLSDANKPGSGAEMIREKVRERADEYLDWLKANYPEEAQRLAELQKTKPEIYKRQLLLGTRKYGRIAEASAENPELAKVLKQDLELRNQTFDILRKINAATDDTERQKLTAELEKATSDRFDVILQRKQMEYDQLNKELKQLQEHLKQSELQLGKWRANKAGRVKERVKDLLSQRDKFTWE